MIDGVSTQVPTKKIETPLTYSVIIPVYNEASTCQELLNRVAAHEIPNSSKEIIIVESNSNDGSRELVRDFAERNPVKVIYQDSPAGKGAAVREGFRAATGEIIIIQDADLEYDIADYERLLTPIWNGKTHFVLGSRHLGASTWKVRKFRTGSAYIAPAINVGHLVFTWIFNVLYGQKLTDPVTMFKVFRRECLNGIDFRCNRFDFDFELVGKLILRGYHPLEVPVSYRSRSFKEGKKIRPFRDPWTWIRVIVMTRLMERKQPRVAAGAKAVSE